MLVRVCRGTGFICDHPQAVCAVGRIIVSSTSEPATRKCKGSRGHSAARCYLYLMHHLYMTNAHPPIQLAIEGTAAIEDALQIDIEPHGSTACQERSRT